MTPDSLVTPIEPRDGRVARVMRSVTSQHAVHGGALCRIEVAAATSCGRQHAVNEDAHTPLDAAGPPFVVADGVGGGAMAGSRDAGRMPRASKRRCSRPTVRSPSASRN